MILDKIIVGQMQVNCYVLADEASRNCLIIDPGEDFLKIKKLIDRLKLNPCFIINTHAHIDHIGADSKFNLPIYIHRLDAPFLLNPERNLSAMLGEPLRLSNEIIPIEEGETIKLDGLCLEVIHTPGHTPGSVCLKIEKKVFTGDTLFFYGVGRTDLPGSSEEQLFNSIKNKLLVLDEQTIIYPGHGPESTIGNEKKHNPFLIDA